MDTSHRLDTESRGIPAVTALTVRASAPWTSSGTKARREAKLQRERWTALGLDGIAYMPKAVVTGTGRLPNTLKTNRRTIAAPVRITYQGNRDHDYTQK